MQEKTTTANEGPVVGEVSKRSIWRRKRIWVSALVIGLLLIFGVVFGAVYGVKNAKPGETEQSQSERERLFAAQGSTSATQSTYGSGTATISASSTAGGSTSGVVSSTTTSSSAGSTSEEPSSIASSSSAGPTSEPSSSPGLMLRPIGEVPRDISAATGAPSLLIWDLRAEGKLWRLEPGGTWEAYTDRQFLVAPVTVHTGENTQTAVSVDGVSGRIVYMHYHDGEWTGWEELEFGAQFLRRPAVVSRGEGKLDVFNIDSNAYAWVVSYDGSVWSEWTELGTDLHTDIAATSWDENRIDIFSTWRDNIMHKSWTADSGWTADWENLGEPFSNTSKSGNSFPSSPLVASWRDGASNGAIDVVVNCGSTVHKLFQNGAWSDWHIVWASHEGYEFPETQSIVEGDGVDGRPFAHLISRGTDNCIHYTKFNGTNWDFWDYTWCNDKKVSEVYYPTEFLPTFIAAGERRLDLVARDLEGSVLRLGVDGEVGDTWSNDNWENLGKPEG